MYSSSPKRLTRNERLTLTISVVSLVISVLSSKPVELRFFNQAEKDRADKQRLECWIKDVQTVVTEDRLGVENDWIGEGESRKGMARRSKKPEDGRTSIASTEEIVISVHKGGTLAVENVEFVLYMDRPMNSYRLDCSTLECEPAEQAADKKRLLIKLKKALAPTAGQGVDVTIPIKLTVAFPLQEASEAHGTFLSAAFVSSIAQESMPIQINPRRVVKSKNEPSSVPPGGPIPPPDN
jgi:hypothetical protein